ncbi:hypothetical protein BC628DRAFT_538310 [Trametes gibbosa]|nr:hypothetical protein BC628DRAFT_538310 [Trametes gibbosa]
MRNDRCELSMGACVRARAEGRVADGDNARFLGQSPRSAVRRGAHGRRGMLWARVARSGVGGEGLDMYGSWCASTPDARLVRAQGHGDGGWRRAVSALLEISGGMGGICILGGYDTMALARARALCPTLGVLAFRSQANRALGLRNQGALVDPSRRNV